MLYYYFQRAVACMLIAVCFPNDIVLSQQITHNDIETSSVSMSTSPKSIRDKKITASSNAAMNLTISDGVDLSTNATSGPTRISSDFVEGYFNKTGDGPLWLLNIKSGALERTGFVALGLMSILLLFFIIRAIRVRHKSKSRKYGIITSTASEMEMEPLEGRHDDDEEETLFDAQEKYLIK